MKILYIGDIMAEAGRAVVEKLLPKIRKDYQPDLIIAQAENVSHGKSMTPQHMQQLQRAGIDFFSGGNHTPWRSTLHSYLEDPNEPVIRPANMPSFTPGRGWKYIQTPHGPVLVISLLGNIVPGGMSISNPLEVIDTILAENDGVPRAATIVNFHGDYSSEKVVIGYYLDGRVTAVVGDHWHVPTADAMVMPKGTAHITDVGMCGVLHSSLGVKAETIITRWKTQIQSKNDLAQEGPFQFNAVLIDVNLQTRLAESITHLQQIVDRL